MTTKRKILSSVDVGNQVLCDICNSDYTHSDDKGGFLFGSKAICPSCAPSLMKNIVRLKEQVFIKGLCPKDTSFREWVIGLRDGNNKIEVSIEIPKDDE